jgi:hypothetical protein
MSAKSNKEEETSSKVAQRSLAEQLYFEKVTY